MNDAARTLIRDAVGGDANAFGELYSMYASELYRFAYYYLGSAASAQDAVQEACLAAFGSISSLREPEKFKSWFFTILANTCKRLLRAGREQNGVISIEELSCDPPARDADSDLSLSVQLTDALLRIAEEERSIVLLSVIGGYNSAEISKLLVLPRGTVRSKLSRALAKLREELKLE